MKLSFEHISKLYGDTAALQQIDLTLGSGVYGLLGPNGAGKTTLMPPDIQLLVGRSSTEAERKRRERLRLQAQKLLSNSKEDICPPENRDKEIREQKRARTNIRTYEVKEEDVV